MPDEIWNVADPMSLLVKELKNRGMEEPESRLLMVMMIEGYSVANMVAQGHAEVDNVGEMYGMT